MKLFVVTACLLGINFIACKPAADVASPPPAPASIDAVKKTLVGKSYTTSDVGLLSPFKSDSSITWMSASEDTTEFFTDFKKERMAYTLKFLNDTAFESMDEGKALKGKYKVDDKTSISNFDERDSETPGIKLRLTVPNPDTANGFGGNGDITYTTYVKGIDDSKLMLALPREMNRQKVVALMKSN